MYPPSHPPLLPRPSSRTPGVPPPLLRGFGVEVATDEGAPGGSGLEVPRSFRKSPSPLTFHPKEGTVDPPPGSCLRGTLVKGWIRVDTPSSLVRRPEVRPPSQRTLESLSPSRPRGVRSRSTSWSRVSSPPSSVVRPSEGPPPQGPGTVVTSELVLRCDPRTKVPASGSGRDGYDGNGPWECLDRGPREGDRPVPDQSCCFFPIDTGVPDVVQH